jgi:hypothetical protein
LTAALGNYGYGYEVNESSLPDQNLSYGAPVMMRASQIEIGTDANIGIVFKN